MAEGSPIQTLVLGGSGFLGAHVVAAAVAAAQREATLADPLGPPVVGLAREPDQAPLFSQPRDAALWRAADLVAPGAAREQLEDLKPEQVVLCAALSRVGDCQASPELAKAMNTDLPGEVATWCREHGVRLVHVSTDLVFGRSAPPRAQGFREDDDPQPVSLYGQTKWEGEQRVLQENPDALVVRLPLLYGNSGGRNLGASDSVLAAVDRDEPPNLFTDEFRTPMEVTNAAEALVELLEGERSGLLHVAGPQRVSRYELGRIVLDAMGLSAEEIEAALRRGERADMEGERPGDTSLDASQAADLLEQPLLGPSEGMQRAIR